MFDGQFGPIELFRARQAHCTRISPKLAPVITTKTPGTRVDMVCVHKMAFELRALFELQSPSSLPNTDLLFALWKTPFPRLTKSHPPNPNQKNV